jgi:hypothetical protein
MGNKVSRANSDNSTNITQVEKSTVNLLNKQINDVTANSMIKSSSSASSFTKISQDLDFAGCKIAGNLNIDGGGQDAKAYINFDVIEVSKVENKVAQEMFSKIMSTLKSKLDSKTLAEMDAAAKGSLNTGFNPFGAKVQSNSINSFGINTMSEDNQNIRNVVKQAINVNFDVETSQSCIDEQVVEQKADFENCTVGGNVNMNNYTQNASVENVGKCLLKQGVANTIVNKAAADLGVETVSELKAETKVKQKGTSSASLTATLFGGMGSAASGISIACLVIVALFVAYRAYSGTIGSSGGGMSPLQIGLSVASVIALFALVGLGIYFAVEYSDDIKTSSQESSSQEISYQEHSTQTNSFNNNSS